MKIWQSEHGKPYQSEQAPGENMGLLQPNSIMHVHEVPWRKDKRDVDLISDSVACDHFRI
jgi:hypothetical protein